MHLPSNKIILKMELHICGYSTKEIKYFIVEVAINLQKCYSTTCAINFLKLLTNKINYQIKMKERKIKINTISHNKLKTQ